MKVDNRQQASDNSKRLKLIPCAVCTLLFTLCASGQAQQPKKLPRIGIVFIGGRDQPHLASFKQGLRERGYIEGKNIYLEYRYAEGHYDRLPGLAADLVRDKVDVIVTTSSISARAVRQATRTIPIVMASGSPVERGLAESFSKPGGNVTGLSVFALELSGKRLELLKETVPKMTRVAALWSSSENESVLGFKETQDAAKVLSLRIQSVELSDAGEMEKTFAELIKMRVDALLVVLSPLVTLNSRRIVELALKQRLPGMYPTRQFVEEGGLMGYGPLLGDLYRRAATYVDKILKGAKPGDLPIEQPTKFELVINLRTAKQIELTIPPNVLARADRVIK
jgi:putative ABC transport system substrate-binding protein